MLRSRFFWKLYLAFAVLVLVTLTGTGFLLHRQLRTTLQSDAETRLLDMAASLVPYAIELFEEHDRLIAGGRGPGLNPTDQAEITRMGEQTETRITLVALDGSVVADSERDPRGMDNHGTRPEILTSLSEPYGVAQRFSDTVGQDLLYVAIAVRSSEGVAGVARMSIPLVVVEARLASLRDTIALGAGLGVLFAMGIGLFVARRITAPVTQMTEVAEALREGRYERRVEERGNDEIGLLGATMNRLADELTHRIATLAAQRAQIGAMVLGLQEGVFAVDEDDTLIFHNRAAEDLLDLRIDEAGSEGFWERVSLPELADLCRRARSTGDPSQAEIRLSRGNAEYVLDGRATAFEADGQKGVVAVLHDITNLRRLEQMRTEFVANVSHELKTPLTSIHGYVETLIDGAIHDDENNLRFLHKIEQQVDRLTAMVTDVLSLARIEATGAGGYSHPTDWRPLITNVVERYRENGELQDHAVELELPDRPVAIAADPETMTQVIENLLGNALKYTPAGGTITVRAHVARGDAFVEVEDNGIGISAADRERIFERFFRADRARSRNTGGTGLGLSIVKHLMQGAGGEVQVTSELGRGSCFTVRVPEAKDLNETLTRP